jgi:hypothetical protein
MAAPCVARGRHTLSMPVLRAIGLGLSSPTNCPGSPFPLRAANGRPEGPFSQAAGGVRNVGGAVGSSAPRGRAKRRGHRRLPPGQRGQLRNQERGGAKATVDVAGQPFFKGKLSCQWARTSGRPALGHPGLSAFVVVTRGKKIRIRFSQKARYALAGGTRPAGKELRIRVRSRSVTFCIPPMRHKRSPLSGSHEVSTPVTESDRRPSYLVRPLIRAGFYQRILLQKLCALVHGHCGIRVLV